MKPAFKHETCPGPDFTGGRRQKRTMHATPQLSEQDWIIQKLKGNPFASVKRYRRRPEDLVSDLQDEFYRRFRVYADKAYAAYLRGEEVTLVAQGLSAKRD